MKLTVRITATLLVFATSTFAGVPDEPEKEKPPVVEKASPEIRAKAEAAIQKGIIEIFRAADERRSLISRVYPLPVDYSVAFIDSAPGDVAVSAERLPFDVRRAIRRANGPVTTVVTGYYDVKAQSVQLYETTTKTYVAAANHSIVKARAAHLQLQPQAPTQSKPR